MMAGCIGLVMKAKRWIYMNKSAMIEGGSLIVA
jgi:hypothetical protein